MALTRILPSVQRADAWAKDPELRILPVPGLQVVRHVGLLERTAHSRTAFTDALKELLNPSAP